MKQSRLDDFFNIKFTKREKPIAPTPYNTPEIGELNNNINNLNINHFKLVDSLPKYVLRFDGASKGNPGISGAGAVLYLNNKEIWSKSKYIGKHQTNNYAEYYGMIIGLREAIKREIKDIYVEGDSDLVIKQMLGEYKVKSKNLKDLFKEAKRLELQFNFIDFKHIYRDKNERADELANIGCKKPVY